MKRNMLFSTLVAALLLSSLTISASSYTTASMRMNDDECIFYKPKSDLFTVTFLAGLGAGFGFGCYKSAEMEARDCDRRDARHPDWGPSNRSLSKAFYIASAVIWGITGLAYTTEFFDIMSPIKPLIVIDSFGMSFPELNLKYSWGSLPGIVEDERKYTVYKQMANGKYSSEVITEKFIGFDFEDRVRIVWFKLPVTKYEFEKTLKKYEKQAKQIESQGTADAGWGWKG